MTDCEVRTVRELLRDEDGHVSRGDACENERKTIDELMQSDDVTASTCTWILCPVVSVAALSAYFRSTSTCVSDKASSASCFITTEPTMSVANVATTVFTARA